MAKTIAGLFEDFTSAQRVVEDLVNSGFRREDISLVTQEREDIRGREGARGRGEAETTTTKSGEGAAAGAGVGAALGGLAGVLAGLGALVIPGIGAVVAAGPIVAGLAGAGMGAAAGGIIGALVGLGIPEEHAEYYAEGVRRGGTLVTVTASDEMANSAASIMNRHKPVDIDQRASQWREQGWTGFEPEAEAHRTEEAQRGVSAGVGGVQHGISQRAGEMQRDVSQKAEAAKRGVSQSAEELEREASQRAEAAKHDVSQRAEDLESEAAQRAEAAKRDVTQKAEAAKRDVTQKAEAAKHDVSKKAEDLKRDASRRADEVRKGVSEEAEEVKREASRSAGRLEHEASERAEELERERVAARRAEGAHTFAEAPVHEEVRDFDAYDTDFRNHFGRAYPSTRYTYDQYRPAYRYGYNLGTSERYRNSDWSQVEMDARREWERTNPDNPWDEFKDAVREAFDRVSGRRHETR